jgi:hypothetical protein
MSHENTRLHAAAILLCSALVPIGALGGCGGSDGSELGLEGGSGEQGDAGSGGDTGSNPPRYDGALGGDGNSANDGAGSADGAGHPPSDGAAGDDATGHDGASDDGGDQDGASGDHDGATNDAPGAPFVPAMHPAFPQIQSAGGQVIANPTVVGMFFSDYDNTTAVSAMLAGLPTIVMPDGNQYWSTAVSEYGVGPLKVLPPVMLSQKAPTNSPDPASLVSSEVESNSALANVDANTVVAVFYPSTTPLSGSCAAQAIGYGGYHDSVMTSKGRIPFAVVSECAKFGPLTSALDMVTVAGSHEIIEAVTDPFQSGYPMLDTSAPAGWAWDLLLQGNEENGDMCTINTGNGRPSAAYPYLLQRGWSNRAAAAGNVDPCQPDILPAQPFVGAFPVMPDMVNAGGSTGPGVKIAVGSSETVEVDCYSFQATPAFTVAARQSRAIQPPELTFSWDKTTCVNGDKLHLTITVQSQGMNGVEPFILYAQLPGVADPQMPTWASIVAQQ